LVRLFLPKDKLIAVVDLDRADGLPVADVKLRVVGLLAGGDKEPGAGANRDVRALDTGPEERAWVERLLLAEHNPVGHLWRSGGVGVAPMPELWARMKRLFLPDIKLVLPGTRSNDLIRRPPCEELR
jgi:hypothetical protein